MARLSPELSHCRALTRSMTCSARLFVAALLACSIPPSGAPRGPARVLATSLTHSHSATTKLSFARISLCSRSSRVSSGSSGAMNVNGRSSVRPGLSSGKKFWKLAASDISGRVTARVPNGMTGECLRVEISDYKKYWASVPYCLNKYRSNNL